MISAERIRSVRIAPATIFFSVSAGSAAASATSACSSGWCPLTFSQIFSAPS